MQFFVTANLPSDVIDHIKPIEGLLESHTL